MTAVQEPISRKKKDFDSRSVEPTQKAALEMPAIDQPFIREPDIVLSETDLKPSEYQKLAFNEEPVTILIHRSGEKFSPRCTDLISINGTKAEMLFKNGWVQMGYLPKGIGIITKRKYVEALAGAKVDSISTNVIEQDGEDPRNMVERVTTNVAAFSVLEDKNPLGAEWLASLLRRN